MRRQTPILYLALAVCPYAAADVLQVPGDSATIQGAIDLAVNGDEVLVAPGTYPEQIDTRGKAIVVRSSDGAAVTIVDGGGVRRGLNVHLGEGVDTVIDGFTFTNCFTTSNGAGMIIRASSSPTIRNCVVEGNEALKSGGGIAVRAGSSPVIEDCTVDGNLCRRFGGGVFVDASTPTLINTLIVDNDAMAQPGETLVDDHYMGGGVATFKGGNATLRNCTLRGNRSHGGGGGMYNRASNPDLTGCVIEQNRIVHDEVATLLAVGGGIWNDEASHVTMDGGLVSANHAMTGGGGLANTDGGVMSLDGTLIVDNVAKDTNSLGGGLLNAGGQTDLLGCDLERNQAGHGGGIANLASGTVTVDDTVLTENVASAPNGRGGGVCNEASTLTITQSELEANEAARGGGLGCVGGGTVTVDTTMFVDNSAVQGGGGVYNEATSPTFTACVLDSNEIPAGPGAVPGLGGGMWNEMQSTPTISDCQFLGNRTAMHGGGMANTDDSAATLEFCPFTGNMGTGLNSMGGGMYNHNASPTLDTCRFESNGSGSGGGMFNTEDASPSMTTCDFQFNTATLVGGAIANALRSHPALLGCEITDNVAGLEGGGIASTADSTPRLSLSRVCDNTPENISGSFEDVDSQIGGNEICVPPPPPPAVPGDVNGDGLVNVDDLVLLIAAWGTDDADADLNEDGIVDVDDLTIVFMNWS